MKTLTAAPKVSRKTADAPPIAPFDADVEAEDRPGVCPECRHEAKDDESDFTKWFRRTSERVTRRKPKPARCQHFTFDEDWQDMREFCECRNPFHGS